MYKDIISGTNVHIDGRTHNDAHVSTMRQGGVRYDFLVQGRKLPRYYSQERFLFHRNRKVEDAAHRPLSGVAPLETEGEGIHTGYCRR